MILKAAGPAGAAAATLLAQLAYPLLDGSALHTMTIVIVVLFCLTSLLHAAAATGPRSALSLLGIAAGIGLAAETLGVHTGVPFGEYAYADTLPPYVLGVPVIVPLAWTMMAYPCLVLGRVWAGSTVGIRRTAIVAASGAWTLAAWDLFLDPQMVAAGHWRFEAGTPGLPGLAPLPAGALADGVPVGSGIPLSNHAGWLLVALVMVAALDVAMPRTGAGRPQIVLPAGMLAWTWLGSGLALVVFLDLPVAGMWGLLAMGVTVAPFLRRVATLRQNQTQAQIQIQAQPQARDEDDVPAESGVPRQPKLAPTAIDQGGER